MNLDLNFKEAAILIVRQGFKEYLSQGEGFVKELFFNEQPGIRGSDCRIVQAVYEWQGFSEEWGMVRGKFVLEKEEYGETSSIKTYFSVLCQKEKERRVVVRHIHFSTLQ